MHSDDFERAMRAMQEAGMVSPPGAVDKAIAAYRESRRAEEQEAAERMAQYDRTTRKLFMRVVLAEDPILGVPVMFYVLVVWSVAWWVFS